MTSEVRAGALFLDKKQPGWENEINVDRLDMGSLENCVLGQLYGDARKGLKQVGITPFAKCGRLGFQISPRNVLRLLTLRSPYSPLTKAWKKEIAVRQPDQARAV